MYAVIVNNPTGLHVDVTDVIADAMGVDMIPEDSAEAVSLAAEYAIDYFGHTDIDAFLEYE